MHEHMSRQRQDVTHQTVLLIIGIGGRRLEVIGVEMREAVSEDKS